MTTSASSHPRAEPVCSTCAPNIIADTYPNNITATINATSFVLVVPIDHARSLLPTNLQSLIFPDAYTRLSIPPTQHPIVLDNAFQHDIRYKGINAVPDQPSLRLTFPFVDLLKDNSTCFRYTSYIYLFQSPIAVNGTANYGIGTMTATFEPADEPYERSCSGMNDSAFRVYAQDAQAFHDRPTASVEFSPNSRDDTFPLAFYRNVTNQPTFGNNTARCDQKVRFWNTSISQGHGQPEHVETTAGLSPPLLHEETV